MRKYFLKRKIKCDCSQDFNAEASKLFGKKTMKRIISNEEKIGAGF